MFKLVAIRSGVFGLAIALGGSEAVAQSMDCMAMGPMVHCDTMGMEPPAPPINCNNVQDSQTPLGDPYAGQSKLRRFLGTLGDAMIVSGGGCPEYRPRLQREQAARFRMQVGKRLADGDCQGAARMAFENGALELGQSISATCRPDGTPIAANAVQPNAALEARTPPTAQPPQWANGQVQSKSRTSAKPLCFRVETDPSQSTCP